MDRRVDRVDLSTDVFTSIGNGAGRIKREDKSPGYGPCEMQAHFTLLFLNKIHTSPQETLVGSWGESNF